MYRRVIPINSVIPNIGSFEIKSFIIKVIFMSKVLHVFCFQIAHWSCILYFLEGVDDKIVIVVHSPFSKHFRAWLVHLPSENIKNVIFFSFENCFFLKILFDAFPIKSDEMIKLLKRSTKRFDYVAICWIDLFEAKCRLLTEIQLIFLCWQHLEKISKWTNGERMTAPLLQTTTNIPRIHIYKRYTFTHNIDSSTMPWDGFIQIVGKKWFWVESLLLRENIHYWHDEWSKWLQTVR
jgi:hypothetical protein